MWRARSVVVELQVWPERDERPAGVAAPSRNWPATARPPNLTRHRPALRRPRRGSRACKDDRIRDWTARCG